MKHGMKFVATMMLMIVLVSCNQVAPLQETPMQSKYYKWTQQSFHPRIAVTDRNKDSITYNFYFDPEDWSSSVGNAMEIRAHYVLPNGVKDWSKNYVIAPASSPDAVGQYHCKITLPIDTSCIDVQFHIKEVKSIREGLFQVPFLPIAEGWIWQSDLGTAYFPRDTQIIFPQHGVVTFAPRSEKLPSPPFSANAPFIPNENKILSNADSSIVLGTGMLLYRKNSHEERIHTIDTEKNPQFPKISQIAEMIGPVRYLCSKEEYDKIQNSFEGPDNAFDKFWIRCGGSKTKAKELIKIYYSRVQDANYHFTSYAEGWKTDRGMIYLVFGHPNTIVTDALSETWIYGNLSDPQALRFEFEIKKDPIWGEIYLLKRSEIYRNPWESQVTQWRQGRIYP